MPENSQKQFGGLVLAGGKSERMGSDKATLIYRGRSLLEHMTALLSELGAAPVLNGGYTNGLADPVPHAGPVGGLAALSDHVAATESPLTWVIVPIDMPLLSTGMLRRLLHMDGAAVHFADHTLPLILRFNTHVRGVLSALRSDLEAPRGVSIWRLLRELNASTCVPMANELQRLKNLNTPHEWDSFQRDN
jgi:molybdopterin-guanine dinucleotide biosynthesis protein A